MKVAPDDILRTPLGNIIDSSTLWRRAKLKSDWESKGFKYSQLRAFCLTRKASAMSESQRSIIVANYPEAIHLFENQS